MLQLCNLCYSYVIYVTAMQSMLQLCNLCYISMILVIDLYWHTFDVSHVQLLDL